MSKQHIAFAPSALLQDVAAAGDDGLHGQSGFLGESVGQDAQDSAILRGRRGQDDELVRIYWLRRGGGSRADEGGQDRHGERTSKVGHAAVSCAMQSPKGR